MKNPTDDFAIYVHWPFCAAKCPYCDFNSHVRKDGIDEDRYLNAYLKEIDYFAQVTGKRDVQSIFFGGGTPSLMPPQTLAAVIDKIADSWGFAPDIEITMEANPSSVEARKFVECAAAGVNRVSIGIQSFNDADLKFLGRLHSSDEALTAIELAKQHFDRFSFDLIYARPGQTLEGWRNELSEAVARTDDHISLYQLTIEPNTAFYRLYQAGKLDMPDADLSAEFFELTQEITQAHGMPAYEISNYARQNAESRHNLIYWRSGHFVGIGPGAHGRLETSGKRIATAIERHPETWLQNVELRGNGLITRDYLTAEEIGDEFLLMGLRLKEGISPARFMSVSGRQLDSQRIDDLIAHDMIEWINGDRLRVTRNGWGVLDAVVADLAA